MSGFIKSVIGSFIVSALVSGATRAAFNRASAPQRPVMTLPEGSSASEGISPEQRFFGIPGASLQTAYSLDSEARQAGIAGETRVAQELEHLANSYPNTYVFHSVKLPGKVGDIDHLVIQGNKMLLVDSKNWKHDAAYHIAESTFEADYITRDGEPFTGGEVHLTRQIAEWQVEFMDYSFDVQAVLVIANRKSTVSESINAPYSLANISGLATVFNSVFVEDGAEPMHPLMLGRILSLVQDANALAYSSTVAAYGKPPVTTTTKWLVAWSFFNYTVMLLLFPIAGISVLPLLVLTHRHKAFVETNRLGGKGLLTGVLVFSYLLLFASGLVLSMVLWTFLPVSY